MDRIVITGGAPLRGTVRISGAKNSALPILAATILGGGECVLSNVPHVVDVVTMGKLLRILGVSVTREADHTVVRPESITSGRSPL